MGELDSFPRGCPAKGALKGRELRKAMYIKARAEDALPTLRNLNRTRKCPASTENQPQSGRENHSKFEIEIGQFLIAPHQRRGACVPLDTQLFNQKKRTSLSTGVVSGLSLKSGRFNDQPAGQL